MTAIFSHSKSQATKKICSPHGGLITYIDENYLATSINVNNTSQIWEGQFILVKDIECNNEIVIGNIYRPPYGNNGKENIGTFISELDPVLSNLSNANRDRMITGDFNINLLHINLANKKHFGEFVDLMLGLSLFPKITFPTRIGDNGHSSYKSVWPLSIFSQPEITQRHK